MFHSALRLVAILLAGSLGIATLGLIDQPAYAASANLVWKPYLQQLTDTSVVVRWTTKTGSSSVVRYSTDSSYSASASDSPRMIGALGTQMHRVTLSGLRPDTTYYYRIYTNNENLWPEQTLTFRTAPSQGSSAPFTFAAFGDFGKNSDSQKRLRDQMARDSFRFLVTTGDNAYDAGRYSEFDTKVFQIYGDVFSKAAVFPTLGNHDYATSSGAPYLDLFSLPRNAWRASDHERYYSFDYGNLHVVALDTNAPLNVSDSAASDDMLDWLRDDLRRTTQPWVVAVVHHAPYSTGSHGSDSRVLSTLVPIFEQYNVDLVLSGHDHIYQRSKPLRGGQVSTVAQGGIVYVVSGAGSAANYGCGSASWVQVSYCGKSYGIYNRIHVNGTQMTVEALDDSGAIRDSFTLNQSPESGIIALPGRFEVEDYKAGGANVGYWDSSAGNSGGAYRNDDVDIQTCSDGSGCYNVGWVTAGEWLAYEVNVAQSGNYAVALRVATPNSGRSVHLELDGSPIGGSIALPNTGSWQSWTTVTTPPLQLPSGRHTLRLVADTSSLNLNSITVAPSN
jgi:3',5'-cyclic AMP phosphodiesterase CpdA